MPRRLSGIDCIDLPILLAGALLVESRPAPSLGLGVPSARGSFAQRGLANAVVWSAARQSTWVYSVVSLQFVLHAWCAGPTQPKSQDLRLFSQAAAVQE